MHMKGGSNPSTPKGSERTIVEDQKLNVISLVKVRLLTQVEYRFMKPTKTSEWDRRRSKNVVHHPFTDPVDDIGTSWELKSSRLSGQMDRSNMDTGQATTVP